MPFTQDIVLLIFLAQFLAYTVKGLIGFGNPLISAPLLSMGLNNIIITPGTLLTDIPINGYISWKNRKKLQPRRTLPLLAAVICGIIPGAFLLRVSLPWVLKTILGVVVLLLGVEMATRPRHTKATVKDTAALRLLVAFCSGVTGGLFGINMFLTAYLQRTAKDYDEFKGSICLLFVGDNLTRLVVYLIGGMINREILYFAAISAAAALLSMLVAGWLGKYLDEKKLMKAAIVLFIAGGVSIIFKSLVFHT